MVFVATLFGVMVLDTAVLGTAVELADAGLEDVGGIEVVVVLAAGVVPVAVESLSPAFVQLQLESSPLTVFAVDDASRVAVVVTMM